VIDGMQQADHGFCFFEGGPVGADIDHFAKHVGFVDTVEMRAGEFADLVGHFFCLHHETKKNFHHVKPVISVQ